MIYIVTQNIVKITKYDIEMIHTVIYDEHIKHSPNLFAVICI